MNPSSHCAGSWASRSFPFLAVSSVDSRVLQSCLKHSLKFYDWIHSTLAFWLSNRHSGCMGHFWCRRSSNKQLAITAMMKGHIQEGHRTIHDSFFPVVGNTEKWKFSLRPLWVHNMHTVAIMQGDLLGLQQFVFFFSFLGTCVCWIGLIAWGTKLCL